MIIHAPSQRHDATTAGLFPFWHRRGVLPGAMTGIRLTALMGRVRPGPHIKVRPEYPKGPNNTPTWQVDREIFPPSDPRFDVTALPQAHLYARWEIRPRQDS